MEVLEENGKKDPLHILVIVIKIKKLVLRLNKQIKAVKIRKKVVKRMILKFFLRRALPAKKRNEKADEF